MLIWTEILSVLKCRFKRMDLVYGLIKMLDVLNPFFPPFFEVVVTHSKYCLETNETALVEEKT